MNWRSTVKHFFFVFRRCIFADTTMDMTEQLPQDVMHVLLEGLVPFHLKHLLRYLIGAGLFTLNDLNLTILQFNYPDYIPNSERPNEIKEHTVFTDEGTFRQSGKWGTCKSHKRVTNYKKRSMNQGQVEVKVNYLNFLLFIQLIVFWDRNSTIVALYFGIWKRWLPN